jgi:hypothetical protein
LGIALGKQLLSRKSQNAARCQQYGNGYCPRTKPGWNEATIRQWHPFVVSRNPFLVAMVGNPNIISASAGPFIAPLIGFPARARAKLTPRSAVRSTTTFDYAVQIRAE